jgi:predicted  nucleic acid-binding Zn ribbon protein
MVDALANWANTYGAVYQLWLDSGAYEAWAEHELSNIGSPINAAGRQVQSLIGAIHECFYWLHSKGGADTCQLCLGPLLNYRAAKHSVLVCMACRVLCDANDQ